MTAMNAIDLLNKASADLRSAQRAIREAIRQMKPEKPRDPKAEARRERGNLAIRLRLQGMTYREVGLHLGVSADRAKKIHDRQCRENRQLLRQAIEGTTNQQP